MTASEKKLTLDDLYLGMEIVSTEQLSNIYDTLIILIKHDKDKNYKIGFIGKEPNEESDKFFQQGHSICPVFNDSMELEGNIYYDE